MVTLEGALYWVLLAGSLLLNLVLGAALFFKSALNDAVAAALKHRAERKQRLRDLLVELHGRLQPFHGNYFLLVTNMRLQFHGPSQEVIDQAAKAVEALIPKHAATLEFMDRHELEFPSKIRERVRDLRKAMLFEDVGTLGDMASIFHRAQLVTKSVNALRADLDAMVK